jgi:hypothetical protein
MDVSSIKSRRPRPGRRLCTAALLALALPACAAAEPASGTWRSQRHSRDYENVPTVDAAGRPVPRQQPDSWMLNYGTPGKPDLLWLGCRYGSGAVVFGWAVDRKVRSDFEPVKMTVSSGTLKAAISGPPIYDPGSVLLNAGLMMDSPVLRRFLQTGEIAVEAFGKRIAPAPVPAAELRQLRTACSKSAARSARGP